MKQKHGVGINISVSDLISTMRLYTHQLEKRYDYAIIMDFCKYGLIKRVSPRTFVLNNCEHIEELIKKLQRDDYTFW